MRPRSKSYLFLALVPLALLRGDPAAAAADCNRSFDSKNPRGVVVSFPGYPERWPGPGTGGNYNDSAGHQEIRDMVDRNPSILRDAGPEAGTGGVQIDQGSEAVEFDSTFSWHIDHGYEFAGGWVFTESGGNYQLDYDPSQSKNFFIASGGDKIHEFWICALKQRSLMAWPASLKGLLWPAIAVALVVAAGAASTRRRALT